MDKHLQIQKQFAVYNDLSRDEQRQVDEHLLSCASCRTQWQAYQMMDKQLADLPDVQPSPQLRSDFQSRLAAEQRRKHRPFRIRQFPSLVVQTAVFACVLFLFISVILSIRNQSTPLVQPIAAPIRVSATPTQTATIVPTVTPIPSVTPTATPSWQMQQIQVKQNGRSRVNDVAVAADGSVFVTTHEDRQVKRWQIDDETPQDSWRLADRAANSVALSRDGSLVAAGSRDYQGYVTLWQTGALYAEHVLEGHEDSVISTAFSPDGKLLASGTNSGDGKVRLWQTDTGALTQTLLGYGAIQALTFSADGSLLAAAVADGSTRIWQVRDGTLQQQLRQEETAVTALTFSPDGELLITGLANGRLQIWQVADGALIHELETDTAVIHSITLAPDGTLLAVANANGTIFIWQLGQGGKVPILLLEANTVDTQTDAIQLQFTSEGLLAVLGIADGSVEIWLANN